MKQAIVFVSALAATAAISASASAEPIFAHQRTAAPSDGAAPIQETADKLFYGRLGQAAGVAGGLHGGPMLGLGMRLEVDRIGLDASMSLGVTQVGPNMEITGVRGSWLKLTTLYLATPDADATPYVGAGLSWGGQRERLGGSTYSGSGLQGELVAGYEMLRSTTIRLFVQADATFPLYRASCAPGAERVAAGNAGKGSLAAPEQRYLPTLGLSLGIAWGRPRVLGSQMVR